MCHLLTQSYTSVADVYFNVADDGSQVLAMVEAEVDERIAKYEAVEREHPDRARFVGLLGCLPYGAANTPRAEQIRKGVEYFQSERERQRTVRQRISALQKADEGQS